MSELVLDAPVLMPINSEKGTLTVVERVYHQLDSDQPTSVETSFTQRVMSDEQPYSRRMKVGEEWVPIGKGWLEECAMLVLRNDPESRFTIPSDEEKAADAVKVIEVGTDIGTHGPFHVIRWAYLSPEKSLRIAPSDIDKIMVRCQAGIGRLLVSAFPG